MIKEPLHVLIIDDEMVDRRIYKRLLGAEHFLFDEADSAASGLLSLEKHLPDCILLDQNLPDIAGLDLIQQIRSDYPDFSAPIILLTGEGSETIAARALRSGGASDYLIKGSIDQKNLRDAIYNAIEKSNALKPKEKITVMMTALQQLLAKDHGELNEKQIEELKRI